MKVPHVIAELVSDFSGFQHTPDFKASRSTGNFEEDQDQGSSSSSSHHPEHHPDQHAEKHHEHHGHSLYFGKHFGKKHLAPVEEKEADTHSTHSGHSGHSESSGQHKKHHGLASHLKEFLHIGHHHKHHDEEHSNSKANSGASTPARKNSTGSQCPCHKHSINITVGADEVPTILATPPNELNNYHTHFLKNQQSPCISRVVSSSSLKEKLNKIKRTSSTDSEQDFPEKKCSVASYRVVTH